MAQWKTVATSAAAISIFMTGSAAFADVSADQVWNDWKDYMAGFGYELDADESRSGDTLTVENLVMKMVLPEDEGSMTLSMETFNFTDNGDGTVSMSIPAELPLLVNVAPKEGDAIDAKVAYNTIGYSVIISGEPDDMTYTYSVAEMTIALAELVIAGEPVDLGSFNLSIADIAGSSNMKNGDLREASQRATSGPIAFDMNVTDPESGGQMQISGGYDSFGFEGHGSIRMRWMQRRCRRCSRQVSPLTELSHLARAAEISVLSKRARPSRAPARPVVDH